MALTTIEYGSLASSATLNNNFNYLDGRITTTATSVSTLSSQISTINTNLTNNKANADLSNVTNATVAANLSFTGENTFSGLTTFSGSVTLPSNIIYLKTNYSSGTSGYNIWSNGYCEQWGRINCYSTLTFIKEFADTNYCWVGANIEQDTGGEFRNIQATNLTTSSCFVSMGGASDYRRPCSWKASGYLAEGQY